jgi:hypothetical protein
VSDRGPARGVDLYGLVGVSPSADGAEIARAYRRRLREVHPRRPTCGPCRRPTSFCAIRCGGRDTTPNGSPPDLTTMAARSRRRVHRATPAVFRCPFESVPGPSQAGAGGSGWDRYAWSPSRRAGAVDSPLICAYGGRCQRRDHSETRMVTGIPPRCGGRVVGWGTGRNGSGRRRRRPPPVRLPPVGFRSRRWARRHHRDDR